MGDLRETTQEIERREQELRDKQEQLVQAGKLATLGELTTGVAHELNNPLNNIGLFVGNVDRPDRCSARSTRRGWSPTSRRRWSRFARRRRSSRTCGRSAGPRRSASSRSRWATIIERALSLMHEQLRCATIEVEVEPASDELVVLGNAIQLEQVFINLLTNARDALADSPTQDDPTRFAP